MAQCIEKSEKIIIELRCQIEEKEENLRNMKEKLPL